MEDSTKYSLLTVWSPLAYAISTGTALEAPQSAIAVADHVMSRFKKVDGFIATLRTTRMRTRSINFSPNDVLETFEAYSRRYKSMNDALADYLSSEGYNVTLNMLNDFGVRSIENRMKSPDEIWMMDSNKFEGVWVFRR